MQTSIHPYRLGTQITLIPICLWWAILPFMGQVGQVLQKLTEVLVQNTSWMISPSLSLSLAIHVILGGSIKCQHDMIWNDRIYIYVYIYCIYIVSYIYIVNCDVFECTQYFMSYCHIVLCLLRREPDLQDDVWRHAGWAEKRFKGVSYQCAFV